LAPDSEGFPEDEAMLSTSVALKGLGDVRVTVELFYQPIGFR
jgi:hypothetical protein